jgi:2-polyprenyl-6-methoxyphenol hydroxylase-like FAD-dependent oxidoreductase
VVVLEKHADFLRDFRGDTIHPSTLELMHELGLLTEFLRLPHYKVERLRGQIGDTQIIVADFTKLSCTCKYIVFMPQWDFLGFLADHAQRYKGFHLMLKTEATGLIERDGAVAGLQANTESGPVEITAPLVVGCDGRHSTIRARAGFRVDDLGAPMDVLWMRISRRPGDDEDVMGRFDAGRIFVMINRGDYWQCAYVIPKGGIDQVKGQGLDAFRKRVLFMSPFLADRVAELKSFDDIKLLSVAVDRLRQWWRPGLICIGDAAHAMSPIGGVGVNLAVQDAVAAANRLAAPLKAGTAGDDDLRAIQQRRSFPVRFTQALQLTMQKRIISPALASTQRPKPPLLFKLVGALPLLQRIPGRLLAVGVRPEHVRTPDMLAAS